MQSKQQIQLNEKDSLQDMLNLEKEIVKLEKQALSEKQPKKKFELVQRIKNLKEQLCADREELK